jgi:pSer/pThr/pTyr-binding forkhead associated (FHA) protein
MPEIIVKLGDRIIHRYFFDKEMLSVGRARDNDIVIENLSVSRNHARIKKQDGKFILTDMNSANGTLVNGVRISKTEVVPNDEITVGKHTLIFLADDEAPASGRSPVAAPTQPMASAPLADPSGLIGLLTVTKGKQAGQEFRVIKQETLIGRASENDIRIHDWFVSKKHASIARSGDSFVLRDLDSWRGTTVNGSSIREIELKEGDEIVFGTTTLTFRSADAASLPPPPEPPVIEELGSEADEDSVRAEGMESKDVVALSPAPPAATRGDEDPIKLESARQAPTAPPAPKTVPESAEWRHANASDLDQLEAEFDDHIGSEEEELENQHMAWEMVGMEKTFETGTDSSHFTLIDPDEELRREEEKFIGIYVARADKWTGDEVSDADEEESLYGGEMTDVEPYGERPQVAIALAPQPTTATSNSADPKLAAEIAMWEKALKNKSSIIRKNAAKELKKLTGKDYDWTIDPTGH